MNITYDKEADAAYIYLIGGDAARNGWVKKTYSCDPMEVGGMINLDFNENGMLGGIEVLGASKKLSRQVLDLAEILG